MALKVLMIVSWYSPKDAEVMTAGVFHYEQSMALQKYCETALYYPFDTTLETEFEKNSERGLLTYRRRMASSRIPKLSAAAQTWHMLSDLRKICAEFKPDVLHAHCGLPAGSVVTLFGKLYGYPVVITEHSPIEHMALDRRSVKAQMHYAYHNSSANICVSGDSRNRLQAAFPDCRFQVVYNGILSPDVVERDDQVYAKAGKCNCCIVAAFYSKDIKGYQYLLPAIAKLKGEGMEIVLHICGGGDYLPYYMEMAKELGIQDSCVFYGSCSKEKVYSIVSQMDFSISASLYECSGVSVEEALLLGKPMLVTRSGGANSLVNEEVAVVVDRGSTDALADGIREMRNRLATFNTDRIHAYAFENFEIDQVSRRYMTIYEGLLESKK